MGRADIFADFWLICMVNIGKDTTHGFVMGYEVLFKVIEITYT